MLLTSIFFFSHNVFKSPLFQGHKNSGFFSRELTLHHTIPTLTLLQWQTLNTSKLEEFADDIYKFNDKFRKFSKQVKNTVGKGEIARYEQFLLFQQCFLKTYTADT